MNNSWQTLLWQLNCADARNAWVASGCWANVKSNHLYQSVFQLPELSDEFENIKKTSPPGCDGAP
jgi:hypothetical protein